MTNRSSGRSTAKTKSTSTRTKERTNKAARQAEETPQPKNNREVVYQKLEELTAPILNKYGIPAFDELMSRMETTVKEFNEEVGTLFSEMVSRSRQDHERLRSLLTDEAGEDAELENESENEEGLSELEKRLEHMDKENASKADTGKGK